MGVARIADVIRRSALAIGALLGAYHVWLLGHQATSGQLSDPATVLRWLVAAVLVSGLAWLWRRGESMLSRPAVAVWVLAALLHGPALANDLAGATPALPEAVATVAQAAAAVAAAGLLLLALATIAAALPGPATLALAAAPVLASSSLARARQLRFLPRPPPQA
jgi:hypothetical protein